MRRTRLADPSGLVPTRLPTGATRPADPVWSPRPVTGPPTDTTVPVGAGEAHWEAASAALLAWGVKTWSGFVVDPPTRVQVGGDHLVSALLGPFLVHEPVRVVDVVDTPSRRGFAYATLPGHPVSGEEAFVLHRSADGRVWLTLRSLTAPGRGAWRFAFPAVLVAQRTYRRR